MRAASMSVLGALGLALAAAASSAHADEAYVCDGGRVAYVRFGELEAMKRKDPCIAAYHGGTAAAPSIPDADAAPPPVAGDTSALSAATPVAPVVLVAGPGARAVPPQRAAGPTAPQLVSPPRLVRSARAAGKRGNAVAEKAGGKVVERVAPPPVPHPETDFRNIKLLNAAPGDSAVYRHVR
jgi:hypothetical protein